MLLLQQSLDTDFFFLGTLLGSFVLLANLAVLFVKVFIRLFLNNTKVSYKALLLYSSVGGLFGIAAHYYAIEFASLKNRTDPESLQPFVLYFMAIVFILMVLAPALVSIIAEKNQKIKFLEEKLTHFKKESLHNELES